VSENILNIIIAAPLQSTAMLSGISNGSVKALYVLGENPMQSDPDTSHV